MGVDSNGILEVTAADKGTGKSEKITITSDKGRLSDEEVQRMVEEAEQYAEEDRLIKERMDARNGLESYLYGLINTMDNDESKSDNNIPAEDKRELLELVDEKLDWMESNPESSTEEYNDHRKEVEQIANPLMRQFYAGGGGGGEPGADEEDEGEFYDSDL